MRAHRHAGVAHRPPHPHSHLHRTHTPEWFPQVMRAGSDVTLVAFGKMVGYCLKAAELLEAEGVSAEVSSVR